MFAAIARHSGHAEQAVLPMLTRVASVAASTTAAATIPVGKPPQFKEFQLYRFNPEQDEKPYYKTYKVDINKYVPVA
jgi:succinate dehydrogenase (ubiquinone) iron-sulfur subunit